MKICPDCQSRYDNDVEVCPNDGEDLVDLPEELSGTPKLPEPMQAAPQDRTSMLDLEALEAKRAAKQAQREAEEEARNGPDEVTPPPELPIEDDGDATGTLQRTKGRKKKKKEPTSIQVKPPTMLDVAAAPEEEAPATEEDFPPDRRVGEEPTERERSRMTRTGARGGTRTGMTRGGRSRIEAPPRDDKTQVRDDDDVVDRPIGLRAALIAVIAIAVLLGAVGVGARSCGSLLIVTVPPGAAATLDGKPIGVTPVQKRVRVGEHVVELDLGGFEPFKEVIAVPADGLTFKQPLQKKAPPPPPPPSPAQIAADLAKEAEQLLKNGDLDAARQKLDEALKLDPENPDAKARLPLVQAALQKREAERAAQEAQQGREARLRQARVLAAEGRRLYEQNQLGEAKEKLYASLKLDPTNPEPHRTLGRIFNREDQVDKVKYHLQRYLDLGGQDADFKVREWLKSH